MTPRLLFVATMFVLTTGFSLTPMSHVIDLEQKQKQVQFLLDNPTAEPMAVEISVRERIQKEDGSEETPVTSELAVFPPQLIIPPNEKRSVRVQWTGQTPKHERAFRVVAEQLPLQVDGKKKKITGIKMLLKYVAALYIDPGNTQADLQVTQVKAGDPLTVLVENKGSRHQMLVKPVLTLKKGEETVKLTAEQLPGMAGENVLAGSKRLFKLPANSKVGDGFSGTLKVD